MLTNKPRHNAVVAGEGLGELVEDAEAAQPAARDVQGRVEFVQVPAQTVLDPGALADQVAAVIDQQPHLAGWAVELGDWQVVVAQRGHRDGLGVDRVGLARLPTTAASTGHQPGRDPHHSLSGTEQVALEPSGQMPAVLEREATSSHCPAHSTSRR